MTKLFFQVFGVDRQISIEWNNDGDTSNTRTPSPPLPSPDADNIAATEPVIKPRFRHLQSSQHRSAIEPAPVVVHLDPEEEKKRKGLLKQLIKNNATTSSVKPVPVKSAKPTPTTIPAVIPKPHPPSTAPPPTREAANLQIKRATGFNKRASLGTTGSAAAASPVMSRIDSGRYSMRSSSVTGANRATNSASVASKALNKTTSPAAVPKSIAQKESETMKLWLRRKEYNPMKAVADAKRNKSATSTATQQRPADDGERKPNEEPVYLSK